VGTHKKKTCSVVVFTNFYNLDININCSDILVVEITSNSYYVINIVILLPIRRSRVIGDFGGYRRLFAYLAAFGREEVGRQCGGKRGCIGL
jgi:hypothetical protein